MNTKSTIKLAISNLEIMSVALENAANDPRNYNTEFASYLDIMSYEMRRQASSLRENEYLLGGIL